MPPTSHELNRRPSYALRQEWPGPAIPHRPPCELVVLAARPSRPQALHGLLVSEIRLFRAIDDQPKNDLRGHGSHLCSLPSRAFIARATFQHGDTPSSTISSSASGADTTCASLRISSVAFRPPPLTPSSSPASSPHPPPQQSPHPPSPRRAPSPRPRGSP